VTAACALHRDVCKGEAVAVVAFGSCKAELSLRVSQPGSDVTDVQAISRPPAGQLEWRPPQVRA